MSDEIKYMNILVIVIYTSARYRPIEVQILSQSTRAYRMRQKFPSPKQLNMLLAVIKKKTKKMFKRLSTACSPSMACMQHVKVRLKLLYTAFIYEEMLTVRNSPTLLHNQTAECQYAVYIILGIITCDKIDKQYKQPTNSCKNNNIV